jgi:hypothetical protein
VVVSFPLGTAESFVGSLLAIAFWFHFDVDDHWRLWKARRGRMMEERKKRRDEQSLTYHDELIEEESQRCQL